MSHKRRSFPTQCYPLIIICLASIFTACSERPIQLAGSSQIDWQTAWDSCNTFQSTTHLLKDLYRTETHTLTVDIHHPIHKVWPFFSDIRNHQQLHPLLQKIVVHDTHLNENGLAIVEFTAVEDILLAGLTLRTPVHAIQTVDNTRTTYTMDSCSAFNIILHTTDSLVAIDDSTTRITETIVFFAPIPLMKLTVSEGLKAHQATFDRLSTLTTNDFTKND